LLVLRVISSEEWKVYWDTAESSGWCLRGRMFYHSRIIIRTKHWAVEFSTFDARGGNMKGRTSASVVVGVLATVLIGIAGFAQQEKPVKTVKGEVVDLWCYMDHAARGEKHKACGAACAKLGNPIGIVDSKGDVYLAVGSELHQADRDRLVKRMAQQVTVTGRVESRGGMKMIYVKTVS